MFLFGTRDTWFVVGIPVFFYGVLSDGTPEGARRAFFLIGGFMALWIIAYGAVQAMAPRLLRAQTGTPDQTVRAARLWVALLSLIPAALALAAWANAPGLTAVIVAGLLVFGAVFALNSALHSYLILQFSGADRVTMDVGFYYMSNAAGRLMGTLLSGLSYQLGGVAGCLAAAALLSAASWLAAARLRAALPGPA